MSQKLQRLKEWIFAPPYNGVPWLVWFYALLSCLIYNHGGVFAGHLSGFDDHVRMTQVLEWINGHGWYDRTIMRANPPEGFTTIWSRLVDIPIATVIILAQFFTDQRTAALAASVIVPFAELAVLFPVARYFARPLVGKDKAWLIVLFIMFTTVLNFCHFSIGGFQTGEASHHSWYTILDLALFGAFARIALGATGRKPICILALSIALLLAVGVESMPMIGLAAAMLAGIAWLGNRPAVARRGAQGILWGSIAGVALLPIHQPPSHFFVISYVEPSIFGPLLVFIAAAFLAAVWGVLASCGKKKIVSLVLIALIGGVFLVGLLALFPKIMDGALAGLSPAERAMARSSHFEANSMFSVSYNIYEFLGLFIPSVIAIVAGLVSLFTAGNSRRRGMRIIYLGFATFGAVMTEDYSRYVHHAMTSACVWLLWFWEKVKERLNKKSRNYSLAALASFVLIGPFWMLLLPAFGLDAPVLSQIVFFPAKIQTVPENCDMLSIAWYINENYKKDKILIVPNWDSSRFLYYTDVTISFVANYPSQDKFIDNDNFFGTRDADDAKDIAARRKIDLVAVCRTPLTAQPHLPIANQTMYARLQLGRPPEWLKYVDANVPTSYALYEVDKKALK